VLAEGVTGDEVAAGCAQILEHGVDCRRYGQHRRLCFLGQFQLILGAFKAEPGDRETEGGVDVVEDLARNGVTLSDVLPHAGVLASLARKDECSVVLHVDSPARMISATSVESTGARRIASKTHPPVAGSVFRRARGGIRVQGTLAQPAPRPRARADQG